MKKLFFLFTLLVIMLGNIFGQNIEVEHLFVNNDFSNQSKIVIPYQPSSVVVNITGIESMPTKKNVNAHAWMEVWDRQGVYFKKRIILDGQGNTSISHEKKNFSVDFCEDEWIGDKTTNIRIGNWVTQDGFHFKAFHTSITKGESPVGFKLFDKFRSTKPLNRQYPYLDYYSDDEIATAMSVDESERSEEFRARCIPDAFPCIVYLNGEYYGIYSWQLKKHRDNYNMGRNKEDNIHFDGALGWDEIWGGNVKWTSFEVRNPKPKASKWTLLCQDGTNYDGEKPKELMGTDSPFYDSSNESCVNSAQTKSNILAISNYMNEIAEFETKYNNCSSDIKDTVLTELKAEIEKRFSMEWMIDYIILNCFIQNGDALPYNWQWTTWGEIDGYLRCYPNPFDLDCTFGVTSATAYANSVPTQSSVGKTKNTPARYVWDYYLNEMKARYAELRRAGVLSFYSAYSLFKDWTDRVGAEHYKYEADKWPNMPCNRDSYRNPNWKSTSVFKRYYSDYNSLWNKKTVYDVGYLLKHNRRLYRCIQANSNQAPDAEGSEEYWEDLCVKEGTYHEGETVYDGYNSFYQFQVPQGQTITVTKDTCLSERADGLVNAPFEKFYDVYPYEGGVHDSLERIRNWIAKKVQVMDKQMNYKNEFVLGDVNHDGKVNIVDATSVTSYILNQKPNSFYEAEADINQDGEISITDVTSIVNMVLGK